MIKQQGNAFLVYPDSQSLEATHLFQFDPDVQNDKRRAKSEAMRIELEKQVKQWKQF